MGTLTSFLRTDRALPVVPSLSDPCLCFPSLLSLVLFLPKCQSLIPFSFDRNHQRQWPKVLSRDCAYKSSVGEMLWVASAGIAVRVL